ncbi:hypothetical protein [Gynurincola endophyticus]|uniref:hypothetical protein n=1 Tax=Gynurincola endophyticus TaxID=2479004 RepID=UPI000F8D67EB|nr:hypothetical protein [Gynurincola endophyticus]
MKNKFLKGAHLSEKEVRDLIRYFCEDVSASEIATITKVSRITVNAYFKLIRNRILTHLLDECQQSDTYYDEQVVVTNTYGIVIKDNTLIAEPILLSEDLVSAMKKLRKIDVYNFLRDQDLSHYNAIVDFKSVRMFKVQNNIHDMEVLESFWNLMKERLVKSRGINRKTLLLHVKEIEFRERYKNKDIYWLLNQLLLQAPLGTNVKTAYAVPALQELAI